MDYYYALLESYSLLKKRRFKLSMREQEEEAASPEDKKYEQELLAIIKSGVGQTTDAPKNINGVDLAQGEGAQGSSKVSGRLEGDAKGMWATLTDDGTSLIEDPPPTVKGMYSKLLPREEEEKKDKEGEEGAEKEDKEKEGEEEVEDTEEEDFPLAEALPKAQAIQDRLEGPDGEGGLVAKDEEGNPEEEQPFLPGFDPSLEVSEEQAEIRAEIMPEGQRVGLVERLYNSSDKVDAAAVSTALETFDEGITLAGRIHAGETLSSDELREFRQQVLVTARGAVFNGVYISYREGAEANNDIPMNIIKQINKAIEENNENCPDPKSPNYKDCYVDPIEPEYETFEGEELNESRRGEAVEHADVLYDLGRMAESMGCTKGGVKEQSIGEPAREAECETKDIKTCEELSTAMGCEYDRLIDRGVGIDLQKQFLNGLCEEGGACLVALPRSGISADGPIAMSVVNFLVQQGFDKPTAIYMVQEAANKGDDGSRALALLVGTSRQFNEYTDSLDISRTEVFGGVGAQTKGQKTDNRRIVAPESLKKYIEERKAEMTQTEQALEDAAKCTGEAMGWDNLGRPDELGGMILDVEVKSMNTTRSGRVKMGEGFTKVFRKMCDPEEQKKTQDTYKENKRIASGEWEEGETFDDEKVRIATGQAEQHELSEAFIKKNTERIDNCARENAPTRKKKAPYGKHTKGPNKGEPKTSLDAACDFQKGMDKDTLNVRKALGLEPMKKGEVLKDADGEPVPTGEKLIDQWLELHPLAGNPKLRAGEEESSARRKATAKTRAADAKEAVARLRDPNRQPPPPGPNKTQKEALGKILIAINQDKLVQRVNQDRKKEDGSTDTKKPLAGKAKNYFLHRLGLEGGSLEECQKDVRGYNDGTQRTGCINASVYGVIAMVESGQARIVGGGGVGTKWKIETTQVDENGKETVVTLMDISLDRGQMIPDIKMDAMSPMVRPEMRREDQAGRPVVPAGKGSEQWLPRKRKPPKKTIKKPTTKKKKPPAKGNGKKGINDELLMNLLYNQYQLFETLLNRTTSNPNT